MDYKIKPFNFGFVILSPTTNFGGLKSTVKSCNRCYENAPIVCATSKKTDPIDIKEMKTLCPTYKGGDTITSLINAGMKKGHKEWNILLMEGVFVRRGIIERYSRFMESKMDVMFPIVVDHDRDMRPIRIYSGFCDCSLNGILIHQETYKNIGELSDNPMEVSRVMWADMAVEKGVKFKAVLGNKIC